MSVTAGQWATASLPGLPLLAGLTGLLVPYHARRLAARIAITATVMAFLAAILLALNTTTTWQPLTNNNDLKPITLHLATFGDFAVTSLLTVDGVAALVAVMVTAVALAVHVYSLGYSARDEQYVPYAAQISLFTGAMLLVVCAGDWITLLAGWEIMGLCSYLLIGHDKSNRAAPAAAVKAFLTTRIGDIGFILGIVLLAVNSKSLRIADVATANLSNGILTAAFVLMFLGVVGKSAQFPLHTWLPDAMAGPTPVSALIHAATMVAAGVYVMARHFVPTQTTAWIVTIIGSITLLLGALLAVVADDIKQVLAFSTISQLGYMVAAWQLGGFEGPALFHLITHAAFKALLFLAAGALAFALGTYAIAQLGGAWRTTKLTFIAMTIGLAGLVGVPPFAGFWSKESILGLAWEIANSHSPESGRAWVLLIAGLAAVPITAFYAMRLWLRVFWGTPRSEISPARQLPLSMQVVLIALTIPAVLVGLIGAWLGSAAPTWFVGTGTQLGAQLFAPHFGSALVAVLAAASGIAGAWWLWRQDHAADPARIVGPLHRPLANGFYVDKAQQILVISPIKSLARSATTIDKKIIDAAVLGVAKIVDLAGVVSDRTQRGLARYLTLGAGGIVLALVLTGVITTLVGGAR